MPNKRNNKTIKNTDTRAGTLVVSVFFVGRTSPGHYPAGSVPGNFPKHFSFSDTTPFRPRLAPGGTAEMNIHYV